MRRSLTLSIFALAAAVCVCAAAAAPGPTFTDPRGDAGGAPDITSVVVSSDAAGVTFAIHTANAAAWEDAAAILDLDTDANPATGNAGGDPGAELSYVLHSNHDQLTLDRSNNEHVASPAATWRLDGSTLTIVVPSSELGSQARIAFWVSTPAPSGEDTTAHFSFSPGSRITAVTTTFAPVVHGRRLALRAVTTHFADGTTGTAPAACAVSIGGHRLSGGCNALVPASARGKQLSVTVTVAGVRVVHRYRIR